MTASLSTVPATDTGIACGHCSHGRDQVRHASVSAVKLCATLHRAATGAVRVQDVTLQPPATDDGPIYPVCKGAECKGMTVGHRLGMVACPVHSGPPATPVARPAAPTPAETVPTSATVWNTHDGVDPGRYAVRGTDGVVKFYKVDKGRPGTKWDGMTFVSVMASDEEHPVRNRSTRIGILAAILVDVDGARRLYGQEIGRCARCNRTLTDETSRAYGMGPECRTK